MRSEFDCPLPISSWCEGYTPPGDLQYFEEAVAHLATSLCRQNKICNYQIKYTIIK